jgi:hypothetical protein
MPIDAKMASNIPSEPMIARPPEARPNGRSGSERRNKALAAPRPSAGEFRCRPLTGDLRERLFLGAGQNPPWRLTWMNDRSRPSGQADSADRHGSAPTLIVNLPGTPLSSSPAGEFLCACIKGSATAPAFLLPWLSSQLPRQDSLSPHICML